VAERVTGRVISIAPGELLDDELVRGVGVAAIAAYNTSKRNAEGQLFHPPEAGYVGYDLNVRGERLYHAGDTDVIPEMDAVAGVDVALLPVWGWGPTLGPGHLDPVRAAEAVGVLRPRVAVPVHWGTLAVLGLARSAHMRRLLVNPPHEFAAAVAASGAATLVAVTQPGSDVALPDLVGGTAA
jgi:L-ascorbate metabolism protein UlaG (beta-lactamase superfamily)